MAGNNNAASTSSDSQNVRRLLPCLPVTLTPGGSARVVGDAAPLIEFGIDGSIRPHSTPELASPAGSSQGRKRTRARRSGKSRRALKTTDAEVFNILVDSGSDVDGLSSGNEGEVDEDENEGISLSLCRFAALQARKALLEEEEVALEQEAAGLWKEIGQVGEEMGQEVGEEKEVVIAAASHKDFYWSDDLTSFSGQKESYGRDPGPTFSDTTDPATIFEKFWDRGFMEDLAHETNEYAWRNISYHSDPDHGKGIPRNMDSWTEVTVEELYRFFAILILMSHCQRGKVHDYWTTSCLGMPEFRKIMPRNRYDEISRFLHFVDNEKLSVSGYDRKVEKVRPILEHCNRKFSELYIPAQHLSLDESLLLWKGQLSWKQCIRTKAARFGIKSFELCEAESGYLLKYCLYTGKNSDTHSESLHGFQDHTAKVVLNLMEGYLDVGHVLVMDNWYNQLPLTRYLKSRHTDVLGTISRRRIGIPPAIKDLEPTKMKRGSLVTRHSGDISLVAWKDVKLVTVMSTYHQHLMVPGKRAGKEFQKPIAVCDYNRYMGGVDLKDQKLSAFLFERKCQHKWYMKVFKRLLNISLVNAFIVYTKNPMYQLLSHRDFRFKVALDLLTKFPRVSSVPLRVSNAIPILRLAPGHHFPEATEAASGTRRGKRQMRCARCTALNRKTLVTSICRLCKAPLCLGQCWLDYHTLSKL